MLRMPSANLQCCMILQWYTGAKGQRRLPELVIESKHEMELNKNPEDVIEQSLVEYTINLQAKGKVMMMLQPVHCASSTVLHMDILRMAAIQCNASTQSR